MSPTEEQLQQFLLGTSAPDEEEAVQRWLDTTPDEVTSETLGRIVISDPLLTEFRQCSLPPADDQGMTDKLACIASMTALAADSTPDIPGYHVGRELGHGGMGVVYEAEDERLERRVAVKVMRTEFAARPDAKERFLREARAMAAVHSEFVVPIFLVGESDDGDPFLVMPLLIGETIESRLNRGPLTADELRAVALDAARGLADAHAEGLIHRDIKPSNLWLEADPDGTVRRARVLDFGLARPTDRVGELTGTAQVVGSLWYMSPEQAGGKEMTDRTDVFSLGATLYHAATGRRPFAGNTTTAVLTALAVEHPPPVRDTAPVVPEPLARLIHAMLAKSPAERPAAADIPRWLARPRRRPWPVWVAATGLVIGLGVAVWLASQRSNTPAIPSENTPPPTVPAPTHTPTYQGKVEVFVLRKGDGERPRTRLNQPGALPLTLLDQFRVECVVDPPAYVYMVQVDPGGDVTPIYPWDPSKDEWTRPSAEKPVGRVNLPDTGPAYQVDEARRGVATVVMFARPTPLDVPDTEVQGWFEKLPDLPLPPGGEGGVVWFENYTEVQDPLRLRTFQVVGSNDPFARWQGELKRSLGKAATFQAAVTFARSDTRK